MLSEMAVADALAIAFEFVSKEDVEKHGLRNDGMTFQQNPRYPELGVGQYTDDTLKAIAIARVILESGRIFDAEEYILQIQRVYREDPRAGWSKGFQSYLEKMKDASPKDFIAGLKRRGTNGALMGTPVLGYLDDVETIKLAAATQAMATHDHTTVVPAQMMALSAYLYRTKGLTAAQGMLLDFLQETLRVPISTLYPESPKDMSAAGTASAVLHHLLNFDNGYGNQVVHRVVDYGGDTDSIAALVVGIVSESTGFSPHFQDRQYKTVDPTMDLVHLDRALQGD